MFPTPDLSHLQRDDYDKVYEPAEDSFLLMDALEKDIGELHKRRPNICLEVGSGSGVVITFLAKMLGQNFSAYFATDINPFAASISLKTASQNGVSLNPVIADLTNGLRLRRNVDVLLFNPPYVITPSNEVAVEGIEASWAGGKDGREVTDRLLPIVSEILSPDGVFYLVALKENKPDEIEILLKKQGFKMSVVLTRRTGPELLSVLKFTSIKDDPT